MKEVGRFAGPHRGGGGSFNKGKKEERRRAIKGKAKKEI